MRNKILAFIMFLLPLVLSAPIPVLRSQSELVSFQKNMKTRSESALIWGRFGYWGKYWDFHNDPAFKNQLDQKLFSNITSCLDFTLFSGKTRSYMPLMEPYKNLPKLEEGEFMKMRIRLFKCCHTVADMPFFLVEGYWKINSPESHYIPPATFWPVRKGIW